MEHYKNLSLKDIDGEKWLPLPEYENIYLVSNKGRLKSLYRVTSQGKELPSVIKKQLINHDGYPQVVICKNGKVLSRRTHRLVASAFLKNSLNKPCINHKNGIKIDNRLENIEWCTVQENSIHAIENKLYNHVVGLTGKLNAKSRKVKQYSIEGVFINEYDGLRECERITGISRGTIGCVCRKKGYYKTAGGFKWEYA